MMIPGQMECVTLLFRVVAGVLRLVCEIGGLWAVVYEQHQAT
jgi:hypothetical protein